MSYAEVPRAIDMIRSLVFLLAIGIFIPVLSTGGHTLLFAEASSADSSVSTAKPARSPSRKKEKQTEQVSIDPEARAFVLEKMVPTKKLFNRDLLRSAMKVPRYRFVPKEAADYAWEDIPIPFAAGEIAPPPFQTLYMLEQLDPQPSDRVWIAGAGTGYPAAVLAPLVSEICCTETAVSPAKKTADIFKELNLQNIRIKTEKPESAEKKSEPFDKIFLTGSAEEIPDWLSERLKEGGVLIVSFGSRFEQKICTFKKVSGNLEMVPLLPAFPVPSLFRKSKLEEQKKNAVSDSADPPLPLLTDPFEMPVSGEEREAEKEKEADLPPGWFGLRNAALRNDAASPSGKAVLWFDSRSVRTEQRRKDALKRREGTDSSTGKTSAADPENLPDLELDELTLQQRKEERITRALRSFPIDGKKIRKLKITSHIEGVGIEPEAKYGRAVVTASIAFFDGNMNLLSEVSLFALKKGDSPWQEYCQEGVAVPKRAESAEIELGIQEGFGILKIDDLTIEKD